MALSLLTACFCYQAAFAEERAGLQGDDQAAYLARLKALYLTGSERQALLAHSNSLLDTYALRPAYQVGHPDRQDLLYHLEAGEAGELLVREERRGMANVLVAVSTRRLLLFGQDPYIRYQCPPGGVRCMLLGPADDEPLLSIQRDYDAAAELAKALTFLIRNVQKG